MVDVPRNWKQPNGLIAYTTPDGTFGRGLWVNEIEQPINLAVQKYQSRKYALVYPRAYAPGNITISGICQSQTAYAELSLFIRKHQLALIDSPVTDRFARLYTGNTAGFRRLLQLSIPTEGILVRGWAENFSVVNKGFADPAPKYNFDFFVVFDQMSEDIGISHTIKGVYNEDDNVYADRKRKVTRPDDRAERPGRYAPVRPDDREDRFTP